MKKTLCIGNNYESGSLVTLMLNKLILKFYGERRMKYLLTLGLKIFIIMHYFMLYETNDYSSYEY